VLRDGCVAVVVPVATRRNSIAVPGIRALKEHFMDLRFIVRALRVLAVVLAAAAQILLHVMT
jgi:hypothetical protein